MTVVTSRKVLTEMIDSSRGIMLIKLNRPDSSNAIDSDMVIELCEQLKAANASSAVRAIVITGQGKNFCAGGDLKAMKEKSGMFSGESNALRLNYEIGIQNIPRVIEDLETPIFAAVNGAAIGAGLDLSCMADIRLCGRSSKFGETFVKLGLIPGDGGAFFLQRAIGYSKALELTLTGEVFGAEKALEIGLVSKICDDEKLLEEAVSFAARVAANSPVAVALSKKAIKKGYRQSLSDQLEIAAAYQGIAQRTKDHEIGVDAMLARTTPVFTGV